jgi:protein-disulfide isomerase
VTSSKRFTHRASASKRVYIAIGVVVALAAAASAGAVVLANRSMSDATRAHTLDIRADREVSALLSGIPQEGNTLGRSTAPVTLQIFADLECLTVKRWIMALLPPIIRAFVRPGVVKIEYRSLKTDTHNPRVFVSQQAAALSAGTQNKMWTFVEIFYHEQGKEYTPYVTERYLDGIAGQVEGLDLARWHTERATGVLSARIVADDRAARAIGFHDTPGFMIGRTGGTLEDFVGRTVILEFPGFGRMKYPVSLIDTQDIEKAIKALTRSPLPAINGLGHQSHAKVKAIPALRPPPPKNANVLPPPAVRVILPFAARVSR